MATKIPCFFFWLVKTWLSTFQTLLAVLAVADTNQSLLADTNQSLLERAAHVARAHMCFCLFFFNLCCVARAHMLHVELKRRHLHETYMSLFYFFLICLPVFFFLCRQEPIFTCEGRTCCTWSCSCKTFALLLPSLCKVCLCCECVADVLLMCCYCVAIANVLLPLRCCCPPCARCACVANVLLMCCYC